MSNKIILTSKDYSRIKEIALRIYTERNSIGIDHFLAICYSEAFLEYCKINNWKVINGDIYGE